ncbi:hypothetical protein OESDEN_22433 [Oesophagostomum dentatum]|uniref:Uncharacterized protein n=1 Tax=Oesophagostomum dentatum TaxID=61180 RepID=A0A0B1S385_OESDE|nr:hypothetical protein OESDEN_22433 [Oesophagostomum dentatum]
MNLRDYLSNCDEVNERIENVDRAGETTTKVLGIRWNATDDTIFFVCNEKTFSKVSKRTVLSQINGYCYDPLGLLTPLMTRAKVFLQDLHKHKYGWDEVLSEGDQGTWKNIKTISARLPKPCQEGSLTIQMRNTRFPSLWTAPNEHMLVAYM